MEDLNLAAIGNCRYAALINRRARVVWTCLPRFDGDPVFCSLLDGEGDPDWGFYDVELDDFADSEQRYYPNTAVLETVLYSSRGDALEIVDFAPRFKQFGRYFRPTMMVRILRPRAGHPRIRVRFRPASDYGAHRPHFTMGSNHIRCAFPEMALRMTTDAPLSLVMKEIPFVLEEPVTLILGPDESFTEPLHETSRNFLERTVDYWRDWSRYLAIPFEWQNAVIRAAITLKLCSFEETGAILAALTTSVPEAANTGRNWDYRYCWLRDSFFVVHALNRLSITRTMEDYLRYIGNIVAGIGEEELQPLFGLTLETRLPERRVDTLAGYRGMGPVRVGNAAHRQVQHDVYGSVVLASTQMFFDERLDRPGDRALFEQLERLGHRAAELYNVPDAGPWELRTWQEVHTFSSLMCWAACDRLARIARQLGLTERQRAWAEQARVIRDTILERAWNPNRGSFVSTFEGDRIDASLLMMHQLQFIDPTDSRFLGTIDAIESELLRNGHMFRYVSEDDFGEPDNAFNICTFWYIDALADVGRIDEARTLLDNIVAHTNHVGLLSEDIDPRTGELWGNFPQTYPMVGLIQSALRLSRSWEEAL